MSNKVLSTVAMFDDLRRCFSVLSDGTAEEEFLRMVRLQLELKKQLSANAQDIKNLQQELQSSLKIISDLENKLFHARRLLESESKSRREMENEKDQLERKIAAVAELLQHEQHLRNETRNQIASLSTLPRKTKLRSRVLEQKYGDINSTGSFLSDLSITQSEDDFLDAPLAKSWRKHRPSLANNAAPAVGRKSVRLSVDGKPLHSTPQSPARRSLRVQQTQKTTAGERISAIATVTFPQQLNGVIQAESMIEAESMPAGMQDTFMPATETKQEHANQSTPLCKTAEAFKSPTVMPASTPARLSKMLRKHDFASKTFIITDTCAHCQRKIRFGACAFRCRECHIVCHMDCAQLLKISCVPTCATPHNKGVMGYLTEHAPSKPPLIPALIVHCINEIESRGLNEVGLYRVSGADREVRALKARFQRDKCVPYLGNIDVHVLCSCIKDFLRSIREPLIPTNLWYTFASAVECVEQEDIQNALYAAIAQLPQANRDTLAFLILHLQRIAESPDVMMPMENLARIFGPTVVSNSSSNPDNFAIQNELCTQYSVMLHLLQINSDYWTQFVALDWNKENCNNESEQMQLQTPRQDGKKKQAVFAATPLQSTSKKRKFLETPNNNNNNNNAIIGNSNSKKKP